MLARSVSARIQVITDRDRHPGLGVPSRLAVRTDAGEVRVDVPASGQVEVPLPRGDHRLVTIEVLDTDRGEPGTVLTGLADVAPRRPGGAGGSGGSERARRARRRGRAVRWAPRVRRVRAPRGRRRLLRRRWPRPRGRGHPVPPVHRRGRWQPTAPRARWSPLDGRRPCPGSQRPGVDVTASSSRTTAPAARPEALVDGDERTAWSPSAADTSPTVTLTLDEPTDVDGVTLSARRGWMARYRPFVGCASTTGCRWCGRPPTAGSTSGVTT